MHQSCTSKNIGYGFLGGLAGGIVFALIMAKLGVINTIGSMLGLSNLFGAFFTHLIISLIMGVIFALLFCNFAYKPLTATLWGMIYGIFWWFLGPLTLMSILLGEPIDSRWTLTSMRHVLPGLYGHIIYGLILGFTYGWLRSKEKKWK